MKATPLDLVNTFEIDKHAFVATSHLVSALVCVIGQKSVLGFSNHSVNDN